MSRQIVGKYCCLTILLGLVNFNIVRASAPNYYDTIRPASAEVFYKALSDVMGLGFTTMDTLKMVLQYATFDSSDLMTTALRDVKDFKRVQSVWISVVRDTKSMNFTSYINGKKKDVNPFVGIEKLTFYTEPEAIRCMDILKNPVAFGITSFFMHRPPREFVRQGRIIYHFYTYPNDFYFDLVKVRDVFLKYMDKPDVLK